MNWPPVKDDTSVQFLGNFPRKPYKFERTEEKALREAIKRLCVKDSGYLAIVGQGGTGKSTLVAKTLQTEGFLVEDCPHVERVIWLNLMKLSSKAFDPTTFYLALAKLIGIKMRKPEAQNDEPLAVQFREALTGKRARPGSILLVLDDVFSDDILPLISRYQSVIRTIAITRFTAMLGNSDDALAWTPTIVNVPPMSAEDLKSMMIEILPDSKAQLSEEQLLQLAKYSQGLPLVARMICGQIATCAIVNDAALTKRFGQITSNLAPVNSSAMMKRRIHDTVKKILEFYFSRHEDMFVKFSAFLVFDEEVSVDAEDLAYLWNVDIEEAINIIEKEFEMRGIAQAINIDETQREEVLERRYSMPVSFEDNIEPVDYADDGPVSLVERHCYVVNSFVYQVATDLVRKLKDKRINSIIRDAGRKHPHAEQGENIMHLASRMKRTSLLQAIIKKTDVPTLLDLCAEECAMRMTPIHYLGEASRGEWFIDGPPPLLIKATLPLMDKLSATPLTDKLLEMIVANDRFVDRLLLLACDLGYSFLVAKLVFKTKANVNAKKRRWPYYNCIMLAAQKGHDAIVRLLMDNGADIGQRDGHGRSALMMAADLGREAVVSMLLEKGADLLEEGHVMPVLMAALEKRRENIAKLLLMNGAEQDIGEELSDRALILAARSCQDPIVVKFLLEKGAEPNSKDVLQRTAVLQATLKQLDDNVRLLLDNGASPDVKDKEKHTALMLAANYGYEDIAKVLVEFDANVNAKDRMDRTALIFAAWKGHSGIVKILLEGGAEPNAADTLLRTPLLLSAAAGDEASVRLLLDAGAKIDARDRPYNKTPLMVAAERGHWAVARVLLERGASPYETEMFNRRNPLMLAAENGRTAIVELLLQKGVDPNVGNAYKVTPLMLASENGHEKSVRLLMGKGADPLAKDSNNRTAVSLACGPEIVKLLEQQPIVA